MAPENDATLAGADAATPAPSGSAPAGRPAAAPPSQRQAMILQVAKVGAIFPITLRGVFGEKGAAKDRATAARLTKTEGKLTPARLARARAGADALIAAGLLNANQTDLLAGIARLAAEADDDGQKDLVACASLGAATLFSHFDPAADHVATMWLGGLRRRHKKGVRPQIIKPRN